MYMPMRRYVGLSMLMSNVPLNGDVAQVEDVDVGADGEETWM